LAVRDGIKQARKPSFLNLSDFAADSFSGVDIASRLLKCRPETRCRAMLAQFTATIKSPVIQAFSRYRLILVVVGMKLV
jgi:hypothetical protein